MDKSTIVCRCEELTVSDIERAVVRMNARTFDDVKRLTRCGMGMCQGKTCQSVISGLISEFNGLPLSETFTAGSRMPLAPLTTEVLATADREGRK
jgi:bacterioferritin-associated ferredoxin